jgi:uncharacterized protein
MQGEALIVAAGVMGLAGLPHCVVMCAAPCAAVTRGHAGSQLAFQVGRLMGYAGGGAVAAWSVGALQEGLGLSPALRPLWTLMHVAALACGLWMLWRGEWPPWLQRRAAAPTATLPQGWQRMVVRPARSAGVGALWIAWPCALSQSALLVSALASTPTQGAAAMALFAVMSSPALWAGPAALSQLQKWLGKRHHASIDGSRPTMGATLAGAAAQWPLRAAGGMVALGAGLALMPGVWPQVVAWCT